MSPNINLIFQIKIGQQVEDVIIVLLNSNSVFALGYLAHIERNWISDVGVGVKSWRMVIMNMEWIQSGSGWCI